MELTARLKKLTEKYGLQPEDVAFADLVHSGWGRSEAAYVAYHLAYFDTQKISKWLRDKIGMTTGINRLLDQFEDDDKEQRRKQKALEEKVSNKQKRLEKEAEKERGSIEDSLRTKSGMLDYLISLSATPGLDLKTKADLAKQITDLQNYKKEEVREVENRVHFYLPLVCVKCSLYMAAKQKQQEEKLLSQHNTPNDSTNNPPQG